VIYVFITGRCFDTTRLRRFQLPARNIRAEYSQFVSNFERFSTADIIAPVFRSSVIPFERLLRCDTITASSHSSFFVRRAGCPIISELPLSVTLAVNFTAAIKAA